MAKARKKKRSLSSAQRAALARGRAALRARRGGRRKVSKSRKTNVRKFVPEKLEPIIIKGESMAKRKKSRKTRKYHGLPVAGRKTRRKARRYHGAARTRRARRYHGAGKFNVVALATDIIGVGVGAVGASFIAQKIPVSNAKIKALIPIVLGLGLGMTKFGQSSIAKAAAGGMIAVGTLSLVKQFFPTVPMLTGADDAETIAGAIDALPDEEKALLGMVVSGEGEEYPEVSGYIEAPLSPDNT